MEPYMKQTRRVLRKRLRVAWWRPQAGAEPGSPAGAGRQEALTTTPEARVADQEDAARRSAELARQVAHQEEIAEWLEHFLQGTEHRPR